MTPQNETDAGLLAMFCGSVTASVGSPVYMVSDQTVILIISCAGALIGFFGLIYTVWNGERHYRLAKYELELRLKGIGNDSRTEYGIRTEEIPRAWPE